MILLDGKKIAEKIERDIKQTIHSHSGRKPTLSFILVGDDPASVTYISAKKKKCKEVGILSSDHLFPDDISQKQLLAEIAKLNQQKEVDGILVQLPLPAHIDVEKVMEAIDPTKDVDGLHPFNLGKMMLGHADGFLPCTPRGIIALLASYEIDPTSKNTVILGRSSLVGKPLAVMLMQKRPFANATVTVAHSFSKNIEELCRSADILIAAMGNPKFVKADMVKEGAVVVDVGINRGSGSGIVGDVDFANVAKKCSYISPVPGGVGPMTIAMLLSNTLLSYQKR